MGEDDKTLADKELGVQGKDEKFLSSAPALGFSRLAPSSPDAPECRCPGYYSLALVSIDYTVIYRLIASLTIHIVLW